MSTLTEKIVHSIDFQEMDSTECSLERLVTQDLLREDGGYGDIELKAFIYNIWSPLH